MENSILSESDTELKMLAHIANKGFVLAINIGAMSRPEFLHSTFEKPWRDYYERKLLYTPATELTRFCSGRRDAGRRLTPPKATAAYNFNRSFATSIYMLYIPNLKTSSIFTRNGMKLRNFVFGLILFGLVCPTAALAFYKPSRVLWPELFKVQCLSGSICIDDTTKLTEAEALRVDAVRYVNDNVGKIANIPRFIFCSTQSCSDTFGQYHAAAYNVGTVGVVIRIKGWEKHYVRHELIHHLQNERLGSIRAFLFKPTWFLEGMAYSLSQDPRRPIPNKTLEGFRQKFEQWNDGSDIWNRARQL